LAGRGNARLSAYFFFVLGARCESAGPRRRLFSYPHEYAHALADRDVASLVSKVENRSALREVRANAFAAAWPRPSRWCTRLSASSSPDGQVVVGVGGTSFADGRVEFGRWIGRVEVSQAVRAAPVASKFAAVVT
jgi:hypothetical protein